MSEHIPPPNQNLPPDNDRRLEEMAIRESVIKNFRIVRDHYALLGVSSDATPQDIQVAYRRLAKTFHPDLNADLEPSAQAKCHQIMTALNMANDVLKDPQQRAAYDAVRRAAKAVRDRKTSPGTPRSQTNQSFTSRLFNDIFQGGLFGDENGTTANTESNPLHEAELERKSTIRVIIGDLRRAQTITEILAALKQLQSLGHSFDVSGSGDTSNPDSGRKTVSPQDLITLISRATKSIWADPAVLDEILQQLPLEHRIRDVVAKELSELKAALLTLKKIDSSRSEILSALRKIARMRPQLPVRISDKVVSLDIESELNRIEVLLDERSDIVFVNAQITQVTTWNDLDLKIYFHIREVGKRLWSQAPIPRAIQKRYREFLIQRNIAPSL